MAHILFISRYYLPEKAAAAVCVSETAKRLAASGHQVTVLTTLPSYPTGIVPAAYQGHIFQEEQIDVVRVVRVWSYASANKGFLRRIVSQLSFGCIAALLGSRRVGKPDIIIAASPPLFTAIAARVLARKFACPFVFWVADLWPESAIQLGALRNRAFIRLAEWLEWSTYQKASLVWAVTKGMRDTLIRRGLAPERILLLMNGVDTVKFCPLAQAQARAELGWDERFTVLYAGTHGLSHGLTTLLKAAEQLHPSTEIHFILMGDGAEKADLIAQAQRMQLQNVTFLAPMSHERMPLALAAADVCLAHTRKLAIFEGMLPMKMYEAMACSRPLILALNGEACDIAVKEAKAALHVEPENPAELAAAIRYLASHTGEAKLLGEHGRAYVRGRFDYDTLTHTLDMALAKIVGRHTRAYSTMTATDPGSTRPMQTLIEK